MKRAICASLVVMMVAVAWVVFSASSAEAFPAFKKAFDEKYMTEGSAISKALEGKSNCNVCHVGMDKKQRNDYGKALDKLLSKDDMKDAEKITKSLEKVESEKSGDTTFGALIKDGKLPITK